MKTIWNVLQKYAPIKYKFANPGDKLAFPEYILAYLES